MSFIHRDSIKDSRDSVRIREVMFLAGEHGVLKNKGWIGAWKVRGFKGIMRWLILAFGLRSIPFSVQIIQVTAATYLAFVAIGRPRSF